MRVKGEGWGRPENPTRESLCLEEGETYTFLVSEAGETSPRKKAQEKEDEADQVLQASRSI